MENLKNLLLACPKSSKEEIMKMCKIDSYQELIDKLIKLYQRELEIDPFFFDLQEPDVNLSEKRYYDGVIKYLKKLNNIIKNESLFFNDQKLGKKIYEHLDNLIINYLKDQGLKGEHQVLPSSKEEIIKKIKEDKSFSNVIDSLIFDVRDLKFLKNTFEEFPNAFSSYFKKKARFNNLIKKYIEIVKNNSMELNDLINVSKIIAYLFNNKTLNSDNNNKVLNLTHLNKIISTLDKTKYSNKERKKIINSLNILITDIKEKKESSRQRYNLNLNEKYGITPQFSDEALKATEKLKKIDDKLYVDLKDKYLVTFDCHKKSCCEDAFSIEELDNGNYLLGIYITDVYSYIKDNDPLNLEAYKRGKTIYLPDQKFTMFPESLVYNQFTLKKNQEKYVLANLFELSPQFDLIKYDIKRAIVKVRENFSFKELEFQLKKGKNLEVGKAYDKLVDIHQALKKNNPLLKYYCNSSSPNNVTVEDVVSSFMIYLNYSSKEEYGKLELPCLYKIHFMDNYMKKIKNKNDSLAEVVLENLQNPPKKSFYATRATGHQGLNLGISMPTTIPVRNYAALENQKLIQKYYIDKEKIKDSDIYKLEENLSEISQYLNKKRQLISNYADEYREGIKEYQDVKRR